MNGHRHYASPLLLGAALLLALVPTVGAQAWQPGEYMAQALGRMMDSVLEISQGSSYGYDDNVCLMGAFLEQGEAVSFDREVVERRQYAITGAGDDDVRDLDIKVTDQDGRVLAEDAAEDNMPVARFTATATTRVTIRVLLFKSDRASYCAAAVLRDGGFTVPQANVVKAGAGLISSANFINSKVEETVNFRDAPNQWAVFGAILPSESEIEITNVALGTGRRVVIAAGDTTARDIDLAVYIKGETASDTEQDATPIVDVTAFNVTAARVKITNAKSEGPCLILMAILQLQ